MVSSINAIVWHKHRSLKEHGAKSSHIMLHTKYSAAWLYRFYDKF